MSEDDRIKQLERKITELEENKKQKTGPSAFLTAAGVLTIIASCLLLVFGLFFLIIGVQDLFYHTSQSSFSLYGVLKIIAGVFGILGFAVGLPASVFTVQRQDKNFVIVGISFLLASSIVAPLLTINLVYVAYLLPNMVLSIIGLVFIGIAHKDFKKISLKYEKDESEYQEHVIKKIKYQQPVIEYIEYKKPFLLHLFVAILIIGIVLVVIGVFFSYYPNSVISGINEKLNSGSLSQSDFWMYSGSLDWWINQQITVYQPLSNFLIVTGEILIIVSSVLLIVFQVSLMINKRTSKNTVNN